jgi:hypothetical protein
MAANGAQYGVATVNYYWIGAIPAMVFLGLVERAMAESDPLIQRTEAAGAGTRAAQAANLFDLRRIIGGVFGVWAILLIILGSPRATRRSRRPPA